MAGTYQKIPAASARSHTRRSNKPSDSSGMARTIILVLLAVLLAYGYQAIKPPQPKISSQPGGLEITAPRMKLRDGRYLAYKEHGVQRDVAKYKIIYVHPFGGSRLDVSIIASLSQEKMKEMGLYIVSFDRPGYGESSPDRKRDVKSVTLDIEELADHLNLGEKFFVAGYSMGGQAVWGCIKYIPHRLAGVALLTPVVNFWWRGFPEALSREAFYHQPPGDQWALRVAHYAPWLTYWWNTQKWFPSSSVAAGNPSIFSPEDLKLIPHLISRKIDPGYAKQQGEFESIHRDMINGFGDWEFDPMDLKNPFPDKVGSVHLWQGSDDRIVPVKLQRYIAEKLPWIHYHELPGAGHLFPFGENMNENILKDLLNLKG